MLFTLIIVLVITIEEDKLISTNPQETFEKEESLMDTSSSDNLKEENEKLEDYRNKNLGIIVDTEGKHLYLIDRDNNKLVKTYVVATGKSSTPTPIGSFKIIQKAKWGEGFGTRWMKLSVPWGKYGIHGTNKPGSIGYNASHGCVRMRNNDIEELYSLVKYNTPVILDNGPLSPFPYGFRALRPGDRGADVQEVQKRLKNKGYYYGSIDGIYGEGMKYALYKFLRENKMPITDRVTYSVYKKLGIILMD